MAREYVITGSGVTLANQPVTLVFINPAATGAGSNIEILRAWVSQTDSTSIAQIAIQMVTQVSTFPTLTSATPAKLKQFDPASGITGGTAGAAGTCGINASSEGAGGKTVIWDDVFNNLNGWLWVPTARETIGIGVKSASTGFGLYLPAAPASLTGWHFGVVYAEMG